MPDAATQIPLPPSPPLHARRFNDTAYHDPESSIPTVDLDLDDENLTSYQRRQILMQAMAARAAHRHANRPYRRTLGLPWYGWAIAVTGMCFLLFMGLWGIKRMGTSMDGERDGNQTLPVNGTLFKKKMVAWGVPAVDR